MLFNSLEFIFLFLPVTLVVFFSIARYGNRVAALWLAVASLFFYGWWNPKYVVLLLASILFNYVMGRVIAGDGREPQDGRLSKAFLVVGIGGNLALLCYYKYAFFCVQNFNWLFDSKFVIDQIVLPLGISFFTFTQIAFLVDTYRDEGEQYDFIHYLLFVTYFPHLIAGPIFHHKEMMPQFKSSRIYKLSAQNIAIGLSVFAIGLFKKMIFADPVGTFARPVFAAAANGTSVGFIEAWGGALAYTLQLYFDFSGYVDMAIGLSMMLGIKLPLNFHSPYKATSIIDFWRRWHITLSRFLRDYLYIPLGGNRRGSFRRYVNVMITVLLGGLWHGAGWTFVIWGGLHGLYLIVNHGWRALGKAIGRDPSQSRWTGRALSRLLTFGCVVVAWVIFRADNMIAAKVVLKGMAGLNGVGLPEEWLGFLGGAANILAAIGVSFKSDFGGLWQGTQEIVWLSALLAVVWFAPNTQQIMERFKPALNIPDDRVGTLWSHLQWQPGYLWGAICGLIALTGLLAIIMSAQVSEFLYFQF